MVGKFFRTDAQPGWAARWALASAFYALLIGAYLVTSHARHVSNPQDPIMPSLQQMADGFRRVALEADRDGEMRLWVDTWASTKRFGIALAIVFLGIPLGVGMGIFPYVEALFTSFLTFFEKIPAVSLLPILFIVFGLEETSKVSLIVIGVFPGVALDAYLRSKAVPREQIVKAKTMGASEHEIAYRIVLPQIFPCMLNTIRLNLKTMIQLLIIGESLAASVGLGYRIFVLRRYVAMDIIIPYVLWMTLLAAGSDWAIRQFTLRRYPWLDK